MQAYILFFIYIILLAWLLTKIRFIKKAELDNRVVAALFIIKVIAGTITGWMYKKNSGSDTWMYHANGLKEYELLFSNPKEYFTNLFFTGYEHGYSGVLAARDSYWNDLKTNLIHKFVSVLDIFSFGNYYVNVVLFNFIVFFGSVALYRLFRSVYGNKSKPAVITCFLLPSLLFCSSTVHKDGLVFAALSIFCFCIYHAMRFNDYSFVKIITVLLCLAVIFLFRSYVFIILVPAVTAWVIAAKTKYPAWAVFTGVFLLDCIVFFLSGILPAAVIQKQAAFLMLEKANSFIGVPALSPHIYSFAVAAPTAFAHTLLHPFFTDYSLSLLLLPFAAEWFVYLLLFLLFVFFRKKGMGDKPFFFFCVFLFVFLMLIIGYTVPALWEIVRYKSIYLPFIVTHLVLRTDWKKAELLISIKK